MLHAFAPSAVLFHTPLAPFYPEELLPELQGMLKALADVELRYERERKRLRSRLSRRRPKSASCAIWESAAAKIGSRT